MEQLDDQQFMNLIRSCLGMAPLGYQEQTDIPAGQIAIDGKKVASVISSSPLSVAEICRRTGMSRENLYNVMDGTRKRMKLKNASRLAEVLYKAATAPNSLPVPKSIPQLTS